MGTMRAGGTAAKRGSLATASTCARSASERAWLGVARTACCRPSTAHEAVKGLPALQGAQVDAGGLAGKLEPRASGMRNINVSGQGLAIFEDYHSASPLLKIAATFFDSTRRAAVSASAVRRSRCAAWSA